MKTFTKFFGLLAVAAVLINASPAAYPQKLDEGLIDHLPKGGKKGAPVGTAQGDPVPSEDEVFSKAVDDFVAPKEKIKRDVPVGYTLVFTDLKGATESPTYLTYKMLPTYSAQDCTDFCNSVTGCRFANLYIEHNAQGDFNKCALFSLAQTSTSATNVGQWRDGVLVTISKSNGYAKNPVDIGGIDIPGFTKEKLSGAINGARLNPNDPDPYMGFTLIATADPTVCKRVCDEKTQYNSQHHDGNTYTACNFFNFYTLYKNGHGFQIVCSFYLIPFDNSYATNTGYTWGTDTYTVHYSYGYARNVKIGNGGVVTV